MWLAYFSTGLMVSLFVFFFFENKVFIFRPLTPLLLSSTRMEAKSCSQYSFFFFFFNSLPHRLSVSWKYGLSMQFLREGNGTPLQYSRLENPMDGRAWWAAVHGVAEGRTRLSDFTFTFHFHALEKDMATHSSVPAWRIPGTGEPGGLPSTGSHRVGHDWRDLACNSSFSLVSDGPSCWAVKAWSGSYQQGHTQLPRR